MPDRSLAPDGRWAGLMLAASTGLTLVFVAHHPVVGNHGGADAARAVLQGIVELRRSDHVVHGALIALLLTFAVSLGEFALVVGGVRPAARAGLLVYCTGIVATIGAATVDGFVIPDVAGHFAAAPPDDLRVGYGLIVFAGLAIQDLTKLGLVLMSAGIVVWSCGLIWTGGKARVAGAAGLIAVAVPAALMVGTGVVLTPGVLLGLLGGHAVWNIAAALLLIGHRGRGPGPVRGSMEEADGRG